MSRDACSNCGANRGIRVNDWGTYCFACQETTFERSLVQSETKTYGFNDFTWDNFRSKEIDMYLIKSGLTLDDLDCWLVGSKGHDRFVVPYYENGKLVQVYAKYIVPDKEPRHYMHGPRKPMKSYLGDPDTIVLVEKWLAMVKVGKVFPSIAMLGTKLDLKKIDINDIKKKNIIIWLDNGKAGREASQKVAKTLKLLTKSVQIVYTEKDPDEYSINEIREKISEYT